MSLMNTDRNPLLNRNRRGARRFAVALAALGTVVMGATGAFAQSQPAPGDWPQTVSEVREIIRQARETAIKRATAQGEKVNEHMIEEATERWEAYLWELKMRGTVLSRKKLVDAVKQAEAMPPALFLQGSKPAGSKPGATPGNTDVSLLASPRRVNVTTTDARWEFIGPQRLNPPSVIFGGPADSYVSGRVNGIAFDRQRAGVIYITGAQGGIWKTTNAGQTWTPTWNASNFPWPQYATAVAVHPTNGDIVYGGTGDFNTSEGAAVAAGLVRSTNGGQTWQQLPTDPVQRSLISGQCVSAITVDPENPSIIMISTGRGVNPGGVYRSTDGGQTWQRANGVPAGNFSSLDYGVRDSTGRRVYYACAIGQGVWQSVDQGANWTQINNVPFGFNTPVNPAGRLGLRLAASKAVPGVFFVIDASASAADGRIFRGSSSAPNYNAWTWTDITGTYPLIAGSGQTGIQNFQQADYDLHLTTVRTMINGQLNDIVYGGCITLASTVAGGPDWKDPARALTFDARIHVDQHVMADNPLQLNSGLAGNDGGVYGVIYNPTTLSWVFSDKLNATLGITQFYKADWVDTNATRMVGGTQDNGSPSMNGDPSDWRNVTGGDGAGCAINIANPNIQYTSSQNGTIYRTADNWGGGGPISFADDWGNGMVVSQVSDPPFIGELVSSLSPQQPGFMYYGTQYLWRWSETSGWLMNTAMPPLRKPMGNARLAADGSFVSAIAVAPGPLLNSQGGFQTVQIGMVNRAITAGNVVYTGSTDGQLWVTFNALDTDVDADSTITFFQLASPTLPASAANPITSISVNPNNAGDILVALASGRVYRCANTRSQELRFTDQSGFGAAQLPAAMSWKIVRDPEDPENTWYLASDVGVFATVDAGSNWANATVPLGLPVVQCRSIEAAPRPPVGTGYLHIATFGRGMWRLALPTNPPPQLQISGVITRIGPNYQFNGTLTNRGGNAVNLQLTQAQIVTDRKVSTATTSPTPINIGTLLQDSSTPITLNFPGSVGRRGTAVTVQANFTFTGGTATAYASRTRLP